MKYIFFLIFCIIIRKVKWRYSANKNIQKINIMTIFCHTTHNTSNKHPWCKSWRTLPDIDDRGKRFLRTKKYLFYIGIASRHDKLCNLQPTVPKHPQNAILNGVPPEYQRKNIRKIYICRLPLKRIKLKGTIININFYTVYYFKCKRK